MIGRAKFNVFAVRAEELIEGRRELVAAIRPLLEARKLAVILHRSTGLSSTGRRSLLPCEEITEFLPNGRKRSPGRNDGDGEFDRFFARVRGDDRFGVEAPRPAISTWSVAVLDERNRPHPAMSRVMDAFA